MMVGSIKISVYIQNILTPFSLCYFSGLALLSTSIFGSLNELLSKYDNQTEIHQNHFHTEDTSHTQFVLLHRKRLKTSAKS